MKESKAKNSKQNKEKKKKIKTKESGNADIQDSSSNSKSDGELKKNKVSKRKNSDEQNKANVTIDDEVKDLIVSQKLTKKKSKKEKTAEKVPKTSNVNDKIGGEKVKIIQFHEMGLDDRLLKAISKLSWNTPTLIQEKAIPLALEGKDILSRARTGSGKTAAYALPILQRLLDKQKTLSIPTVQVVVLVPSRELSVQVFNMFQVLIEYCSGCLKCVNMSTENDGNLVALAEKPNIVVGTPSRLLANVNSKNLSLDSIEWLVVDEADLLLSFGYEKDLKELIGSISNSYQCFITSATFSDETNALKKLLLHNPVTLNLKETSLPSSNQLTQYHVICNTDDDKFLLLCALIKLNLIRGKSIIFVNDVHRCFKLKLFLEQFSIFCCVLNPALPVNARSHTLDQFNKGLYTYIIATDTTDLISLKSLSKNKKVQEEHKKKDEKQKEFSVSRGIDFQYVSNVLNFDFPDTLQAYVHRVGRTARGDAAGTALSFVLPEEKSLLEKAENEIGKDASMRPYVFAMDQIEGLRYRCNDVLRSITKSTIREARLKDIKNEIKNSSKLKSYFEENPRDLQVLRHDTMLQPSKVKKHMKHVPDYLIPDVLKGIRSTRKRSAPNSFRVHGKPNPKYKKKQEDPLKSFKYNNKHKK